MTVKITTYQNPNLSIDCVIFGFDGQKLNILLIERENQVLALPGDLITDTENLDDGARRVLAELTHVEGVSLQQFHTFGDPERLSKPSDKAWLSDVRVNPTARVITVGYYALVRMEYTKVIPDSFAENAIWLPLYQPVELAFDHNKIVDAAVDHLRRELKTYPIGFELLPAHFTFRELKALYEAILNKNLDKRNFYKKILASGLLIDTGKKEKNVAHKPAKLYRLNKKKVQQIRKMSQLW